MLHDKIGDFVDFRTEYDDLFRIIEAIDDEIDEPTRQIKRYERIER